jgi:hypothetical protein
MKMLHVDEKIGVSALDNHPRTWSVAINPMHVVKAERTPGASDTQVDLYLSNREKLTIVCAWPNFCDMLDEAMQ